MVNPEGIISEGWHFSISDFKLFTLCLCTFVTVFFKTKPTSKRHRGAIWPGRLPVSRLGQKEPGKDFPDFFRETAGYDIDLWSKIA